MNAPKTAFNLVPSFLLAREFHVGWATEPVTKGACPITWDQAQAWFNAADAAAKQEYNNVRADMISAEMERIAKAGGWSTETAHIHPRHLNYGAGDPPSTSHTEDERGDYSWTVGSEGTVAVLASSTDDEGNRTERARLVIPAKGKGDVVLTIREGAAVWHLLTLRRAALALGETPTAQALLTHIAARKSAA